MFLYKIEIQLQGKLSYLILLSDSDEKAFAAVEGHVARHFIKTPELQSVAIVEKKRPELGTGYLIELEE
jgi:hypothetical protein